MRAENRDPGHINHRVEFHAGPTQRRFIEDDSRAALFASRAGEGKSAAICWAAAHFCRKYARANPSCIIARNTLVNLRATTLQEFFKWFPPGVFGTWSKTEMLWKWKVEGFGGQIRFMGFDDEKSTQKVLSMPVDFAGLDEAAPATDVGGINELVLDMLLTRARNPRIDKPVIKVAVNNTDEDHWLYPRFVDPGSTDFRVFQTGEMPENLANVREGYYEEMARDLSHRPDLARRYIEGKWGYQQIGVAVTPQWSDDIHLAHGLKPVRGLPLLLSWDFGGVPTCVVSQATNTNLNVLLAMCQEGVGTYQLIEQMKPILVSRFDRYLLKHTGDYNGRTRDPGDNRNSPVRFIKQELGGSWRDGPVSIESRIEPLQKVLSRTYNGRGVVQVDAEHAKIVHYALRGGWHKPKSSTGVVGREPVKDKHSHPGDCMGYEAARSYPASVNKARKSPKIQQAVMRSRVQTRFAPPEQQR